MFAFLSSEDDDALRPDSLLSSGQLSTTVFQDIQSSQLVKCTCKAARIGQNSRARGIGWASYPFCTLMLYFNSSEDAVLVLEYRREDYVSGGGAVPDDIDVDLFGREYRVDLLREDLDDDEDDLPDDLVLLGRNTPLSPSVLSPASNEIMTEDDDAEVSTDFRRELYMLSNLDPRTPVNLSLQGRQRVISLIFAARRGSLVLRFSNRHDLTNFDNFLRLVVPGLASATTELSLDDSASSASDLVTPSGDTSGLVTITGSMRRRDATGGPSVALCGGGVSGVSGVSRTFSGRDFGYERAHAWDAKKIFEWLKRIYYQQIPRSPLMSLYDKICTLGVSQNLFSWLRSAGRGLHHLKEEYANFSENLRSDFSRNHPLAPLFRESKVMTTFLEAIRELEQSNYLFDETKQIVMDKLIAYKEFSGKPILLDALRRNLCTKMRYLYDVNDCKRKIFFAILFEKTIEEWIEETERQLMRYFEERIEEAEINEEEPNSYRQMMNEFNRENQLVFSPLLRTDLEVLLQEQDSVFLNDNENEIEGEEDDSDSDSDENIAIIVPEALMVRSVRRSGLQAATKGVSGILGSADHYQQQQQQHTISFYHVSLSTQLKIEKQELAESVSSQHQLIQTLTQLHQDLLAKANKVRARKVRFELVVKKRADLEGPQRERLENRAKALAVELTEVEEKICIAAEHVEEAELELQRLESQLDDNDRVIHYRSDKASWLMHRARSMALLTSDSYFKFLDLLIDQKLNQLRNFKLIAQLVLSRLREIPRDIDRVLAKLIVDPFLKPAFYQFGFVHASFALKNLGFHWFSNSLVMAKDFKQYDDYYEEVLVVDVQCPVLPTANALDRKITHLASELVAFNQKYQYVSFKVIPDGLRNVVPSLKTKKNCQEFTMEMLATLGYAEFHAPVVDFIGSLKGALQGTGNSLSQNIRDLRRFTFDDAFALRFSASIESAQAETPGRHRRNEVIFETHLQLDQFVQSLLLEEADFVSIYSDVWSLLKSWDGGFWLRFDKARGKKGDPDIVELNACEEAVFGCPVRRQEMMLLNEGDGDVVGEGDV